MRRFLWILPLFLLAACTFSGSGTYENGVFTLDGAVATYTPLPTATATQTPTLTPTVALPTVTPTLTPTVALPTVTYTPLPTATTVPTATPVAAAPPVNFAASAQSSTSIRLTWERVATATAYRIESSPDGVTGWAFLITRGEGVSEHLVEGLAPGATHYFRVRSINATLGHSEWVYAQATTALAVTCDHTLPHAQAIFDGAVEGVLPGHTVCLPEGERGKLEIHNVVGTQEQPVRFITPDGVWVLLAEDSTQNFKLEGVFHTIFDGGLAGAECGTYLANGMPVPYPTYIGADGLEHQQCGIRILGGANSVTAIKRGSDIWFRHMEVGANALDSTFGAGWRLNNDDDGSTFANLRIEHSFAHDTANECIYISRAASQTWSPFTNARVVYNYLLRCAWGSTNFKFVQGGEFAYNYVDTVGIENEVSNGHGNGLDLEFSSGILVHHNVIGTTAEACIKTLEPGTDLVIEFNVLYDCGLRRAVPSARHHILDRYSTVNTIVSHNTLFSLGLGLDVRGSGEKVNNWLDGVQLN